MGFWKPQKKKLTEQTLFNKYINFISELQRIVTPESYHLQKKEQDTHQKHRTKRIEDHLQAGFTTSLVVRGVISLLRAGPCNQVVVTVWSEFTEGLKSFRVGLEDLRYLCSICTMHWCPRGGQSGVEGLCVSLRWWDWGGAALPVSS